MLVLGIETSCDETSASVLRAPREVLANVVYTQLVHERYGGVVPELASREHIIRLVGIVDEALTRSGVNLEQIDAFAVTYGPGLVGALLVGLSFVKSLSQALNKPFVGVNHLEGHIFANYLESEDCIPPFIALVVSGGHSSLYHVTGWGNYRLLGKTRDDAPGEAFDKVAKLLGLPYPGGRAIEKAAQSGRSDFISFPRARIGKGSYEFSFSGLKTAVALYLRNQSPSFVAEHLPDICASFQEAVCDVLASKAVMACNDLRVRRLAVSGGVAVNKRLRALIQQRAEDIEVYFPAPVLCTDNAAMIAAAGAWHLARGEKSELALNAVPYLQL